MALKNFITVTSPKKSHITSDNIQDGVEILTETAAHPTKNTSIQGIYHI